MTFKRKISCLVINQNIEYLLQNKSINYVIDNFLINFYIIIIKIFIIIRIWSSNEFYPKYRLFSTYLAELINN